MGEVIEADVARAIEVFEGSRPSLADVDRMPTLFAASRLATRKLALEEAARLVERRSAELKAHAVDAKLTAAAIRALTGEKKKKGGEPEV
jgi:hypothetical protein